MRANQLLGVENEKSHHPSAFISTFTVLSGGLAVAQEQTQSKATENYHCDKPVARVLISNISCKSANCNAASAGSGNPIVALLNAAGQPNVSGIGDGIKEMMTTALQQTRCFNLIDRKSQEIVRIELEAVGRKLETEAADFVVSGVVTQIELEKTSASFGRGLIPVIGSIGKTTQKASVVMDLRLVSVTNAQVVGTKNVSSTTEDSSFGVGGFGFGGHSGLIGFGGGLSKLKGTSLELVTREVVMKATAFLVLETKKAKGIAL